MVSWVSAGAHPEGVAGVSDQRSLASAERFPAAGQSAEGFRADVFRHALRDALAELVGVFVAGLDHVGGHAIRRLQTGALQIDVYISAARHLAGVDRLQQVAM